VKGQHRIGGAAGTFWTPEQTTALLAAARKSSERDYLIILMLLNHALRASELTAILPTDIRDGHLHVARLKGSKRTVQPLTDDEKESLWKMFGGVQPDGRRLFSITRQQVWRIVQKHCKTAGIPLAASHPHSAKHTICRKLLTVTGNNLNVVQVFAGHSDIRSTTAYTKPTDAQASEAAAPALNW
jgi:integrase